MTSTTDLVEPVELNLFRPEFTDDPRPVYHRLREMGAIRWTEAVPPGCWLVTGYDEAYRLLRDARLGKSGYWDQLGAGRGGATSEPLQVIRTWLSQIDPPDHMRIRGAFGRSFTPRAVERLRVRITEIIDELLDPFCAAGGGDFVAEFAFPLPAMVIADILGVPRADVELFKQWSLDLSALFDVFVSEENTGRAHQAIVEFQDYASERIAECRRDPGTGLLSALVAANEAGEIDEHELRANVVFTVWAGHETTMALLGTGLLTLLRHPEVWAELRAEPALVSGAVEECMRYESPLRITSRIATEDLEVGGAAIRADQMVVVMGAAANHDPSAFPDPDRFDPRRAGAPHVGFGGGIHFCMGAPLVRVEAEQAFARILERMPELTLRATEPGWSPDWSSEVFLRRLNTLEVEL